MSMPGWRASRSGRFLRSRLLTVTLVAAVSASFAACADTSRPVAVIPTWPVSPERLAAATTVLPAEFGSASWALDPAYPAPSRGFERCSTSWSGNWRVRGSTGHRPDVGSGHRRRRRLRLDHDRGQRPRRPTRRTSDVPGAARNACDPDALGTARSSDLARWRFVAAGPSVAGPAAGKRPDLPADAIDHGRPSDATARCFRLAGTIARTAPDGLGPGRRIRRRTLLTSRLRAE